MLRKLEVKSSTEFGMDIAAKEYLVELPIVEDTSEVAEIEVVDTEVLAAGV